MKKVIFILSIILLFQCSNDDSNSETPYSDISVDYVYPENNADTIPINHQFLLYFNQAINPDELRKKVILSTETDGENQQVWYNVERYQDLKTHEIMPAYKICVIKPSNQLEQNKLYTLTINKGLLSTEHGQLKETLTYSFTTAQGTHIDYEYVEGVDRQLQHVIKEEYNSNIIQIWFNEHLNPYYVNYKSVLLVIRSGPTPVEIASIQYDPHEKRIIIYPENTLEAGIEYMVRLATQTNNIYDLGGTGYDMGKDMRFTLE